MSPENIKDNIPTPFEFNTSKLVILLENEPLSDNFEQLMLTHDQVLKVLDLLESFMPHEGKSFKVSTNSDFKIKIKDIPDSYLPEAIATEQKK